MNNQLAIVFCIHHKPWLIMSTLISLALQDYQDFDIYAIYQKGDGSCLNKKSYEPYFKLVKKYSQNVQLSPYDERVRRVVRKIKFKAYNEIEFENDHGLDSGVWYKFIKTKKWKNYDYTFFIQEGTLLTRTNILSDTMTYIKKNNIHFLSSGHEKRKIPKKIFLNYNIQKKKRTEFDYYHDEKIREVFNIFNSDKDFKRVYKQWRSDFTPITQNHVPDVIDQFFYRLYQIARSAKHLKEFPIGNEIIYENALKRRLKDVLKDYKKYHDIIFHKDNDIEWFGCSCQHILSNELLSKFFKKMEKNKIFRVLDIPFVGTPLEVIWGFIPAWLGFDKWFFDGIHRVRKNFVNYKREDDSKGMCYYLNQYFKGIVKVVPDGDFIKIQKIKKNYQHIKKQFGALFFKN